MTEITLEDLKQAMKIVRESKESYPCMCTRFDLPDRYCQRHDIIFINTKLLNLFRNKVFKG
jgi:hypothetical protein